MTGPKRRFEKLTFWLPSLSEEEIEYRYVPQLNRDERTDAGHTGQQVSMMTSRKSESNQASHAYAIFGASLWSTLLSHS